MISTKTLRGDDALRSASATTTGCGELIVRQAEPVHVCTMSRFGRRSTVAFSMRQSCVPTAAI